MRKRDAKSRPSERLREFVRDRVKPGGAHYRRGNAAQLARHLKERGFGEDAAWISSYTDGDAAPRRNADVDVALEICEFFSVQIKDFTTTAQPASSGAAPSEPLPRHVTRAVKLMLRMNEQGQLLAVKNIAGLAVAFPKPPSPESTQRSVETASATVSTRHRKH